MTRAPHSTMTWVALTAMVWLMLLVAPATSTAAHAAPQDGLDPTGSNLRIWGSPSFNRQIGPDDEIVQVAAGGYQTVARLADGSLACWGRNKEGQCTVPSGIGTPENSVTAFAAGGFMTVALLEVTDACPADFDGDGVVGGRDLGRLFAAWGPCANCDADLDGDGVVGGEDLTMLFAAWGACP